MKELTLYDIMGEGHYIVADREDGQIRTCVIDENDEVVFEELSHRFAWDSLVSFARMVIREDEKIQEDLNHE